MGPLSNNHICCGLSIHMRFVEDGYYVQAVGPEKCWVAALPGEGRPLTLQLLSSCPEMFRTFLLVQTGSLLQELSNGMRFVGHTLLVYPLSLCFMCERACTGGVETCASYTL